MASFCVEKFGTDNVTAINEQQLQDRVAAFKALSYVEMMS
jgi:hypothetical protein